MAKMLGKRTSYSTRNNETVVLISGKVERWKESLLVAWLLAWTVCGAILIWQLYSFEFEDKQYIILYVIFAFWAYFEYRIGKVTAWRIWGRELIKINRRKLVYKRAILSYGKAYEFFLDNVGKMEFIPKDERSWSYQLASSWWVMGGETIGFDHMQHRLKYGLQLEDDEAKKVMRFVEKTIAENKKTAKRKEKAEG